MTNSDGHPRPSVSSPEQNSETGSQKDLVSEEIWRICRHHFEKSLQETLPSSMTIAKKRFRYAWRPNNWRREMQVKKKSGIVLTKIGTTIDSTEKKQNVTISKHTKLVSWKNYQPQITIQYGKNTLTGIWNQERIGKSKKFFLIEGDTLEEVHERIDAIKNEVNDRVDAALLDFARQFKIKLPMAKPRHTRSEDCLKGDDFLDSLPEKMIIHNSLFKKVYRDQVEFISKKGEEHSIVRVKNYIKNRAIEDIAPEIAGAIGNSNNQISELTRSVQFFADNLNAHIPVYEKIGENTKLNTEAINDFTAVVRSEIGGLKTCLIQQVKDSHKEEMMYFLSPSSGLASFSSASSDSCYRSYVEEVNEDLKNFDWLLENIGSVEEGIMYRASIEALRDDLRWELAQGLQKRLW